MHDEIASRYDARPSQFRADASALIAATSLARSGGQLDVTGRPPIRYSVSGDRDAAIRGSVDSMICAVVSASASPAARPRSRCNHQLAQQEFAHGSVLCRRSQRVDRVRTRREEQNALTQIMRPRTPRDQDATDLGENSLANRIFTTTRQQRGDRRRATRVCIVLRRSPQSLSIRLACPLRVRSPDLPQARASRARQALVSILSVMPTPSRKTACASCHLRDVFGLQSMPS